MARAVREPRRKLVRGYVDAFDFVGLLEAGRDEHEPSVSGRSSVVEAAFRQTDLAGHEIYIPVQAFDDSPDLFRCERTGYDDRVPGSGAIRAYV